MFRKVLNDDKSSGHIWTLSKNALLWTSDDALRTFLYEDFDQAQIFAAYNGVLALGLFAATNIDQAIGRANLFVWLDQRARNGNLLPKWWILFLDEMRASRIDWLFAAIKKRNSTSWQTAARYDFKRTSQDPTVPSAPMEENVVQMVRSTQLTSLERKVRARAERLCLRH